MRAIFERFLNWAKGSEAAFWAAWIAFAIFAVLLIFSSNASARDYDQVTFCQFTALETCEIKGDSCAGGDTPDSAEKKLGGKKPSAIVTIPDEYGIHGEAHIYVANSGKHIYLEYRDGRLFSAATDYDAWLNSSKRCGVGV